VKQDFKEALRQYTLRAKTDSPRHSGTGQIYELGEGVTVNTEKRQLVSPCHRPG